MTITMTATLEPEPSDTRLVLRAVIDTADGAFRAVQLGQLLPGRQTYEGPLFRPDEAALEPASRPAGWRIVAIVASLPDLENGFGPPVDIRGTLALEGLPELADPAAPADLDVSISHDRQVIRGHVPTDGLVLPALVSPALMDQRDSAGQLSIELASGLVLHVRPVASVNWFPTMTEPIRQPVVLDAAPLFLAINADNPGQGLPNEALLKTPSDARTAEVVGVLEQEPFPPLVIQARPALEALVANDPFALGLSATLLVGAMAGLGLALAGMLLAALAELRDERGELADLEEQGLGPGALRRLTTLRSMLVLVVAIVAGLALGVGLTWFGTAAVAVGLTDAPPVPPLVAVIPWGTAALLAACLGAAVGGGTLLLGLRRYGERRLLREAEA